MRLFNGITAKVLVWLAAILVPAESLPLMACGCGSHCPWSSTVKLAQAVRRLSRNVRTARAHRNPDTPAAVVLR